MRVLLRITLTLLIALPLVLGLAAFFALQLLRGAAPPPVAERSSPPREAGIGQERTAT